MPVYELACPDCGHVFRSLVVAGARLPQVWVCSACGSRSARPRGVQQADPLSGAPAGGCGCG